MTLSALQRSKSGCSVCLAHPFRCLWGDLRQKDIQLAKLGISFLEGLSNTGGAHSVLWPEPTAWQEVYSWDYRLTLKALLPEAGFIAHLGNQLGLVFLGNESHSYWELSTTEKCIVSKVMGHIHF